jgi:hypothetical protein
MNTGFGFSFREKLIRSLGFMMLMVITFIGIMLAAGWKISFVAPKYCEGQRTVEVKDAGSFWEIAKREFPSSDPRYVTDELVRLNGTAKLDASIVKAPSSCKD